jgi:hypothetical protein
MVRDGKVEVQQLLMIPVLDERDFGRGTDTHFGVLCLPQGHRNQEDTTESSAKQFSYHGRVPRQYLSFRAQRGISLFVTAGHRRFLALLGATSVLQIVS